MRIGLTCHANFGGSGVIATELGLALAERGHDVHVVTAHAPPRLREATHVTLHVVESPTHPLFPHGEYTLALASKLAEVCRAHALEVLHVHYAIPLATSALLACEVLGNDAPRLVTTVHGTDVLTVGQAPAFKPLVRQALRRSDLVTAPSRFLAQVAARDFALGETSVEVVSNFVDTRRFVPRAAPPGRQVLAHNSNFRSIKRMQDVVRIFERVHAQVECELLLVGDGPERPALEAFIDARGLGPHVQLLGEQRDVAHVLQESSVFLLPSEVESFGLAAAEAMSCGVPVVASDSGGLPEVIEHGRTGFLHPVGDVDAMAASAVRLLRDGALHRSMSEAARAACLSRFQPGPLVDAWEAHYAQLLRKQP
jgi:N-acetyl-alpha-D-glucosaminyl L-malate synthase BshA